MSGMTFHSNPVVETGCFVFNLHYNNTNSTPPPTHFRVVPNQWDSKTPANYLRAHVITPTFITALKFDDPTTMAPYTTPLNILPTNWGNHTSLYFRFGTTLLIDNFKQGSLHGQLTIMFCSDTNLNDCNATPTGWIPDPTQINQPDVIPHGPTTIELNIPIKHECLYSVSSFQTLNQWRLPPHPILRPTTQWTQRTMWELLLKDAFLNPVTLTPTTRVDFFDIKLIGAYYFDFYLPHGDINRIEESKFCYLDQLPVVVGIGGETQYKSLQTREIRIYLKNSATNETDIYSYIKQITPSKSYRVQLSCNQNLAIRNDFLGNSIATDLPLFIQVQLGYYNNDEELYKLQTTPTEHINYQLLQPTLYPDRFSQFSDSSKLSPFRIPPPRVRNIGTEFNQKRNILSTSFLLEFSNTTGGLSGPLTWDTREYLLYHTNFKLSVVFDSITFDVKNWNPGGRTTDIRSETGYAALHLLPDIGFEDKEQDWGPIITMTKIYQDPFHGFPKATFDFYSPFKAYNDTDDDDDDNLYIHNNNVNQDVDNDVTDLNSIFNSHSIHSKQSQPQQNTNHQLPPLPYYRDVPLSPYHSFEKYASTEIPYETIPIRVMIQWYFPSPIFQTRFPQWTAQFDLEHTNPTTLEVSRTMFELVTYFNATIYGNLPPTIPDNYQQQQLQQQDELTTQTLTTMNIVPQQEPKQTTTSKLKLHDRLYLDAYCGPKPKPGFVLLLQPTKLALQQSKQLEQSLSLLTSEYRFPWDALTSPSFQGREQYSVQNVELIKYSIPVQNIYTQCVVEYLNNNKILYQYIMNVTITNSINTIQFEKFQFPEHDQLLKELLLSSSFNSLRIACPDIYYNDFGTETTFNPKKFIPNGSSKSNNNNNNQNNQFNILNNNNKELCTEQKPSCETFPSCFYYETYDPDVKKPSIEGLQPIICDKIWKSQNEEKRTRVRLYAIKNYPQSQLSPQVIILASWMNVVEPWSMPIYGIVLLIIFGIIMTLIIISCTYRYIEQKQSFRRANNIKVFDNDDTDFKEQFDDIYYIDTNNNGENGNNISIAMP